MLKQFFLFLFIIASGFSEWAYSQKFSVNNRPCPDWVYERPVPKDENKRHLAYYVGIGYGNTLPEATNKANADALKKAISAIGVPVSSKDLYEAEHNGDRLKLLIEQFNIPIDYLPYDYYEQIGNEYKVYVLCQASLNANYEFIPEPYTETFNKYNTWEQDIYKKNKKANTKAVVASAFIPGMGQMLKGQGGKGSAFLLSELALFGGGTACWYLGQEQVKTMKAADTSYEKYKDAKNMKNTYDIIMYTCFGVGAALHITNMVHAWYVPDKKTTVHTAFAPAIIPTNEYSQPSYAMGAGIQITF